MKKSFYRLLDAVENFDGGRARAGTVRDMLRLHIQTVEAARGGDRDGTLAR